MKPASFWSWSPVKEERGDRVPSAMAAAAGVAAEDGTDTPGRKHVTISKQWFLIGSKLGHFKFLHRFLRPGRSPQYKVKTIKATLA
ncbi:hypothetical protein RRG08_011746 [Elysia crispata]|uniref:Uncharacterized protein n=1 Tax=Elysia crispata TaxID=231223 RepID=A0AAE0XEQ9_9GAST|nr:hypothetical protein RRG08_011746 [Elysia crispata]